jgi:NAD(P)H-hydrate repair Nnr-like enzyme with NAD(P)H-hydrate epimerase domain
MPKIVTVEQMRAIELASDAKGHTYADDGTCRAPSPNAPDGTNRVPDPRVVIIVGPGSNGGDGYGRVCAEIDGST